MTDMENLALVRRYYDEIVNRANLALADQVFAPEFVSHHNDPVGLPPGAPGVKQFVSGMRSGFSDFELGVDEIFSSGDLVAARWTMQGTHDGVFFEIPPTGKKVAWQGVAITRVAGDRIVEEWFNFDQFTLLAQLGAIPASG